MKTFKRILASLLVAVMVVTAAPLSGFVGLDLDWLDFNAKAGVPDYKGSCGEGVYWSFEKSTGTLTISGSGEFYDANPYSTASYPWICLYEQITNVVFEDDVRYIPPYAFYGFNDFLTSVKIGDNVSDIGVMAFANCDELISVEFGNALESIGELAFANTGLESVDIPDGVVSIESGAFEACDNLVSVTIPASTTSIAEDAFSECNSLASISVDSENESYLTDEYGVFYNKGKTMLIRCPKQMSVTEYSIPDTVKCICDNAFAGAGLTNIFIPEGIESIGRHAIPYTCCTLDNGGYYIGNYLISVDKTITDFVVRDGTKLISDSAFNVSLSNNVENVTIAIPDSVEYIGVNAFNGCHKLSYINVDSVNNNFSSDENGILYNKDKTVLIRFPKASTITEYTIPNSVIEIAEHAFRDCGTITKVVFPESLRYIGDSSFRYCYSLTEVSLPDSVVSIGNDAFYNCENIVTLNLGNGVETIGDGAFQSCYEITGIKLPENLKTIGKEAFSYCNNVTSIEIPKNVVGIGELAFESVCALERITVDADNKMFSNDDYGVLFNKDKTELLLYPSQNPAEYYSIPDSVTYIEDFAFFNCQNLKDIFIPTSVTEIGDFAFYNCTNLSKVRIPDSVKHLGMAAFISCTGLVEVRLPSGSNYIGAAMFNSCENLKSAIIPSSVSFIVTDAFGYADNYETTYFMGTEEQWNKILIGGYNEVVTKNVVFDYVPVISSGACGEGVNWTLYENGELVIEGSGKMDDYSPGSAPWNNEASSIIKVTIKDGVTTVGDYAFSGCENLTQVALPETIVSVGDGAFENTDLKEIFIPENVTEIGTGDVICLTNDYEVVCNRLTAVIFGDVNGDGWYDGTDSIIVSCLANGMLTKDDIGEAVYMAADCNHDGTIDALDVALLEQAGALLANVDQSKTNDELATDVAYIEYLDLIDQTPEVEEDLPKPEDADEEGSADIITPEQDTTEISIIELIIKFIKSIFDMLFSRISFSDK